MKKVLAPVFVLLCIAAFGQSEDLTPKEFQAKSETLKDAVIIDLRTPDEIKAGIIPGATIIDYFSKSYEKKINTLDKSKTYLLYCASGGRSGETLELMKKKGFIAVYHLAGGFEGWKKEGLPIDTPKN